MGSNPILSASCIDGVPPHVFLVGGFERRRRGEPEVAENDARSAVERSNPSDAAPSHEGGNSAGPAGTEVRYETCRDEERSGACQRSKPYCALRSAARRSVTRCAPSMRSAAFRCIPRAPRSAIARQGVRARRDRPIRLRPARRRRSETASVVGREALVFVEVIEVQALFAAAIATHLAPPNTLSPSAARSRARSSSRSLTDSSRVRRLEPPVTPAVEGH